MTATVSRQVAQVDEGSEDVELVAFGRAGLGSPKRFDFPHGGEVIFIVADRADILRQRSV
ncbi:hypothetical protein [Methylocella sp.]|uniref:hypothetical protein n=1 Tax=Methylocella sp. TaxID=1978226 RepID=UPI0037836A4F